MWHLWLQLLFKKNHDYTLWICSWKKKTFKCDICNFILSVKSYIKTHVSSVYERKKWLQMFCKKSHKHTHVASNHDCKMLFKCDTFDYSCSLKRSLTTHVGLVHKEKKSFKCNICDFSCYLIRTLNIHVGSVHERKKPFKCDICNFRCSEKSYIKTHIGAAHDEKKPLKCEICNYCC